MSRSSVLASLASQDVSASEFDKLDADNGSDYQGQIDLKSPLASPTFTGSITTPEIRSGSTLTIDPATVGDNTGLVLLKGNLQVDGTSTTINSTTLTVDDLNLTLASGAADSAAANGAGITIDGASATMTYTHSTTSFDFNKPVNVTGGGTFSGNVGIGASPSVNLHIIEDATEGTPSFAGATHFAVQATASSSDNVNASLISGSSGTSRIMFGDKDDEDTGKIEYDNSINGMKFFTNTTERLRIDSSGNVGIGTSSVNSSANLHIASGDQNSPHILLENTVSSAGDPGITFADSVENYGHRIGLDDTGNDFVFTYKSGGINPLHGVDTEIMRLDSSGNVGIGTAAASGKKLHVNGDTQIDGNLALIGNDKTISSNNSGAGYIKIFGGGTNEGGAIEFRGAGNSGDLRFLTGTGSGAGTERMRIDGAGRLSTPTGSQLSSQAGTTYTLYSADTERQLDTNGYTWRTMRKVAMNRSGSVTVTWDGYISSGSYYWSYNFKINGTRGTTTYYTSNSSTNNSVHAYNSYSVNLNVNHGDIVDLEFTTVDGQGDIETGTGQDLFIKNFKIKATTPESIVGLV